MIRNDLRWERYALLVGTQRKWLQFVARAKISCRARLRRWWHNAGTFTGHSITAAKLLVFILTATFWVQWVRTICRADGVRIGAIVAWLR